MSDREDLLRRMAELEQENERLRALLSQAQDDAAREAASLSLDHAREQASARSALAASAAENRDLTSFTQELERHRAALQASETRTRAIFDSVTDYAILTLDLAGRVTSWNAGAQAILGWTEEEVIGRTTDFMFTPEDVAAGMPAREQETALREGRAPDERWHLRRDGSRFWASGMLTPLRDGTLHGFVKVLRDRTPDQRADAALRESEDQLRQLADALPVFVSFIDPEERYRLVNRTYEDWFGQPRDAIVGRTIREMVGEAAYAARAPWIQAALRGERVRFETFTPRPDGTTRTTELEYLPRRDKEGRVEGFYALITDLTERRRGEEAVRESEARLRLAIDAGRMAIWELDVATDRVTASPELNRLLGFPPDATPSIEEIRSRYYPGERERLQTILRETIAASQRYNEVEFRCVWPDGTIRWLLLRAEVHLGPDGQPARVVGVLLDITDRKRGEERQHLLLHEISHRVKNTLATVLAIATLTARTTTDVRGYRDKLIDRVQAMAKTHDLLTSNSWEGAALRDLVANELAPYAEGRRVVLEGPDLTLSARAAVSLGMMMHELTTNAAKYGALSAPRGQVRVSWTVEDAAPERRLHLAWEETGGPTVTPPESQGFGTTLIQKGLARELGANIRFDFASGGLRVTLAMPLAELKAGTGLAPWAPGQR